MDRVTHGYAAEREISKRLMDSFGDMQRRKNNPVIDIFDDLTTMIIDFQTLLDNGHEVGLFVSGSVSVVHIREIRRRSPSLLIFDGVDSAGNRTVAVQHIAQLNLQLVAVPKIEEVAYRVGFIQPKEG